MPSLKTIKRKLQKPGSYREALIELGFLREHIERIGVQHGDTILFKLGDHSRMTTEMIRVFLDVASQRGLSDINGFLMKPGDSVEKLSDEAFDQLARLKGYVKEGENAVSEQSATEGDGDRGASPGETPRGESEPAVNVEAPASPLREHSGEGPPVTCCESVPSGAIGPLGVEKTWVRPEAPARVSDVFERLDVLDEILQETNQAEEVSDGAQERAVFLPNRDEERAGARDDERENGRPGEEETEGLRAEDPQGERFLSDEEVEALSERPEFWQAVVMWVGKQVRDDQIARNGAAPLQEQRGDE